MLIKINSLEIFKQNEYRQTDIGYVSNNAYLSIVATNKCQRDCFYCINSNTDRTLELPIAKAIVNIKKLVEKYRIKDAVILGGEPLLHKDILSLCKEVKETGIQNLYLTTNGIALVGNNRLIDELAIHLNGINISFHNEDFMTFEELHQIYCRFNYFNVKVRVNTNIWLGNHNSLIELKRFINKLRISSVCDEIRVSNLIKKDDFSVNTVNNPRTDDLILTDEEYQDLFGRYIADEKQKYSIFLNKETLGFVRYFLIPSKVPVIINWNLGSTVSRQVCENDISQRKINTFKCLVSGDISLSWNINNIIKL